MNVVFRPLRMRDLGAIEQIEKRAYPTPWSRSMFASELAKASSICVGAFEEETDTLVGYLIIARYVDAWHVMNIAVDPEDTSGAVSRRPENPLAANGSPKTNSAITSSAADRLPASPSVVPV